MQLLFIFVQLLVNERVKIYRYLINRPLGKVKR